MNAKFAKITVFLLFWIALAGCVSAATIHGIVYDLELNKATNSIISINTTPMQQFVAKQGEYSFIVPEGDYTITANILEQGVIAESTEEWISVQGEGPFVIDLILFPNFDEDIELIEESEISIPADPLKGLEEINYTRIIIGVICIILISIMIIVYFTALKKRQKKDQEQKGKEEKKTKERKEDIGKAEKDEADEVVEFIRKQGKRTTQKEIRKAFPQSEAKISLILADLEDKGKIKKIKKGRGNIIILK